MKIQWLGTAAAEAYPAIFCECDACLEAARRGGHNLRTRASAIIDDVLLIDLNPDLLPQKYTYKLDFSKLKDIIITHTHSDHLYLDNLCLQPHKAYRHDTEKINLFGSEMVIDKAKHLKDMIDLHEVAHGQQFETTYHKILAVPAIHSAPMSQFYFIEKDNKSVLYAHDTDYFSDEIWAILESNIKAPIGIVSLDCSLGPLPRTYVGHMGFAENIEIREVMLEKGLADEDTIFVCNHFIHTCGMMHEQMCKLMNPKGFVISYDGMIIEI